MSFFRQIFREISRFFFPEKDTQNFSEQPTRPLDAKALAQALAGEGRRHISPGFAKSIVPSMSGPSNSLYLLLANSDGLNALPDFGIAGVAEYESSDRKKEKLSGIALSTLANQLIRDAVLDFLALEGFENQTPLQNIVGKAMNFTHQYMYEKFPDRDYSLTAGLIFAEIMILGHRGSTRAYHIDRHHIERITGVPFNAEATKTTSEPLEVQTSPMNADKNALKIPEDVIVYSRPVPRDGYVLLCTSGLWKHLSERDIHAIILEREAPHDACQALISRIKESDSDQELSILLLYFPPDFVPWR
jgi:serine/threonine protein phosphatase PrpC